MSQIEDLQSRITRALDRIGQGIDGLNPGPAPEDYEALRGRAEAAEQELAQTREAFAAAREQAEADLDAAVSAARSDAAAEMERALAEARAASDAEVDAGDTPEVTELKEALDEEQMANAQLQERLRVLKARMAESEAATGSEPAGATSLAALDAELQKLRAANEELMAANAALREANAQGVGEPELINRGMEAELEALRAARSADAAETGAVLDALTPLLAEAADDGRQG
ncbi:hypothetical protein SAMN04488078_101581 [Antarctobacter heliothermus]|uniref:Colicin transporter n=2 Tax=Antarctobacter heliothermus TaxID=74033 RepID=A0A239EMA2_9RHOB|nr:hypothetical protein SAMN04488078_101581 [Antarctobacter heliothermus]